MSELKIGDVVTLKSGGPKMTIDNIGGNSMTGEGGTITAWVSWFDAKMQPQKGSYPLTSLKHYQAPKRAGVKFVGH